MGEVFIKIKGKTHHLWRVVDQHGVILDISVTRRRNNEAAKREVRSHVEHQQHIGSDSNHTAYLCSAATD